MVKSKFKLKSLSVILPASGGVFILGVVICIVRLSVIAMNMSSTGQ